MRFGCKSQAPVNAYERSSNVFTKEIQLTGSKVISAEKRSYGMIQVDVDESSVILFDPLKTILVLSIVYDAVCLVQVAC